MSSDKGNTSYLILLRNQKRTQIGRFVNSNAKEAAKLISFWIVIQLGPKPDWFIQGKRRNFIEK